VSLWSPTYAWCDAFHQLGHLAKLQIFGCMIALAPGLGALTTSCIYPRNCRASRKEQLKLRPYGA